MKYAILYTILFALPTFLSPLYGQTDNLALSTEGVVITPSDSQSELWISPAELQTLLEEIMEFKRKRMRQLAKQRTAPSTNSNGIAEALNDQNLREKIRAIETNLVQINQKLDYLAKADKQPTLDEIKAQDLSILKTALASEMDNLKNEIKALAVNPTPPVLSTEVMTNDTTYRKAVQDYFVEYARQMIALQSSLDSLESEMDSLATKSDFAAFEKQLTRFETRIQTPVVVQSKGDTTAIVQNVMPTDYLDKQFGDIRKLISALEKTQLQTQNQNHNNPAEPKSTNPPIVTQIIQTDTSLNGQIAVLQRSVEELKNLYRQPQNYQKGETEIVYVPKGGETPLNAEISELKKMILELKLSQNETIIKEKTITEAAPPDTTYNYLKEVISGKEKQSLLFANNSFQLNNVHISTISDAARLLNEYGDLDILVKGYTSEKGSPIYNQTLSQNRAEAVKKQLMSMGIHPSRIFTQYHGIDYQVTDPAQGRRVDLILMIRK